MKELYALKVSLNSIIGDRRGSRIRLGRHARPKANATGTRNTKSARKVPKRTIAAAPGDSAADIIARTSPGERGSSRRTPHRGKAPRSGPQPATQRR